MLNTKSLEGTRPTTFSVSDYRSLLCTCRSAGQGVGYHCNISPLHWYGIDTHHTMCFTECVCVHHGGGSVGEREWCESGRHNDTGNMPEVIKGINYRRGDEMGHWVNTVPVYRMDTTLCYTPDTPCPGQLPYCLARTLCGPYTAYCVLHNTTQCAVS